MTCNKKIDCVEPFGVPHSETAIKKQIVHNDEISPCGRNDSMPLMAWVRLRRRRSRRRNLTFFLAKRLSFRPQGEISFVHSS